MAKSIEFKDASGNIIEFIEDKGLNGNQVYIEAHSRYYDQWVLEEEDIKKLVNFFIDIYGKDILH